jgi:hydrogenase/urease accessory protein HupE
MAVNRTTRAGLAAALAVAAAPGTAHAHLVSTRFGDFYGGLLHPLMGLEYVIPWVALGLLAALQGSRTGRWMLLAFPLGVGLGVAACLLAPPPGRLLFGVNLASFVIIGGLIVLARPLPAGVLAGLGAAFGLAQGWDNALAITPETNAVLFFAGVTAASYVVVTLVTGAAAAALQQATWVRIAVRAAGSWLTAIGLLVLGVKLAGV